MIVRIQGATTSASPVLSVTVVATPKKGIRQARGESYFSSIPNEVQNPPAKIDLPALLVYDATLCIVPRVITHGLVGALWHGLKTTPYAAQCWQMNFVQWSNVKFPPGVAE
jgi:hypothetical protein